MKRRIMLLIMIAFMLSGCWDSIETEQLGVITVMGIGLGNSNELRVIMQEQVHEKQQQGQTSSGKAPFFVYEGTGATISEVLNKIPANQHHRLYFAHTKAIILSEELVREKGIRPVIDFYERYPEIRLSTWLLIVPKGQLDKILSTDLGLNSDSGRTMEETIDNQSGDSFFIVNNLKDFIEILNRSGSEPYSGGISLATTGTSGGTSGGTGAFNTKFDIQKTAVFKNEKMVGWLSDEEHRGLSIFLGTAGGGIMMVPFEEKLISLRIIKIKSMIKPVLEGEKKKISINVEIESKIVESQLDNNYMDDKIIKKIEKAQNNEVKKEVIAVVDKARELDSDFLGFGSYFNMKYPKYWKKVRNDWYSHFAEVEVNINVNTTVKDIGKIYKSYKR